ncbi:hypothetical protein Tco_1571894 [Tanacetum coccineum]
MVLGISPVAIIDPQLPFEYTITSRLTDVMAQPIQNINHSAFRSMFEREKLSGKKMYVIEQPLLVAPAADSEAQIMHNMGKIIGELHTMLIEYEKSLPKKAETPQVMMIKGGKNQKVKKISLKAKGKGKASVKGNDKQVYIPKPKNPKPSAKEHPTKDDTCHHCKEVGH